MQAIRVHPAPSTSKPYSVTNPAPSSSLHLDTIPIPTLAQPDEILIRVKATTIIRDTLTWPEMYDNDKPYPIPGNDFAGVVEKVSVTDSSSTSTSVSASTSLKPGDEVFGMAHADRPCCWAEYAIVKVDECSRKPSNLNWEEAASVPLTALTAWQSLFVHGGVAAPVVDASGVTSTDDRDQRRHHRVLVTGASGAVGIWVVQLARLAGCHVVAGTTSKSRSEEFLKELGADEVAEYGELVPSSLDTIVDMVGGALLEKCWSWVKDDGVLLSVESTSFTFAEDHRANGIAKGKDAVKALFFIVEPSKEHLEAISKAVETGKLRTFVAGSYPLAQAKEAYDICHGVSGGRGKIILLP